MRRRTVIGQAIGWLSLWGFWASVSRHNHPTVALDLIASALLVATFAAAVYANHLWLIPRYRAGRRPIRYLAALLLVMGLLALACALAIHLVYDLMWGPDPARFGFASNVGLEFAGVAIHVVAIAAGVRVMARFARPRPSSRSAI